MKCQKCDQAAAYHVTEMINGEAEELHVCEKHLPDLETLKPAKRATRPGGNFGEFWRDPNLREVLKDAPARQKLAAHLLPALCLALLDGEPAVRVLAAFHLMCLGPDAQSAAGALREAARDPHSLVARAATIAQDLVESGTIPPWFA
jgi:hypothetical protein